MTFLWTGLWVLGKVGRLRMGKSGQATVEYAIVAAMLTALVAILSVFLYTFRQYGGRVLDLVAADYP